MIKKILKTALAIMLGTVIISSVSSAALAADSNDISIKMGDNLLTVSDIQIAPDGRTYAPYDELFDAIGATASYDKDSQTVTATAGDTTVAFVVGQYEMTVNSVPAYTFAPPFADSATGKIYVPVRYAAQALGYVVGWDSATGCITLQYLDDLIEASGATYSIMDKYLAYQKVFSAKSHAVSGTFGLNLTLDSVENSTPLTVTGSLSGFTRNNNEEMSINLKANAADFAAGFADSESIDAQTTAVLAMLNDLDMNIILNGDIGMIYLQSPALTTFTGIGTDAWLSLDINQLYSGIPMSDLIQYQTSTTSFKDMLSAMLKSSLMYDTGDSTMLELQIINSLLSDQAMVKDGDYYVSTYKIDQDGANMTIKLTFEFHGGTFRSVTVDMSGDLGEQGAMSMTAYSNAEGSGSMRMKAAVPTAMTMDMKATFKQSQTYHSPASQPAAGSTIIPMDSLLEELTE